MAGSSNTNNHQPGDTKCHPFRIVNKEGVGNCVVATEDIKQGQTILTESPAVWGPNLKSGPKCCNCLARWRGYSCPHCQFPVCDETCANGPNHSIECGVLANLDINITFTVGEAANPAMSLINVVRFLRLPNTNPETASKVAILMDHVEDMMAIPEVRDMWRVTAVEPLTRNFPSSPYSEGDVMRAVGVLQTNTVSLAVPGQRHGLYTALYPTFSFLSHSCLCNAKFSIQRDRTIQLVAQTDIKAGEEITIQYMTPMLGNVQRRNKIRKNWYFDCSCARCEDPSELGTNVSGAVCQDCQSEGVLLPSQDGYTCTTQTCTNTIKLDQVQDMEASLEIELEQCDSKDVEALQRLLEKWLRKFHPQHFLILLLKRKLLAALKLITSTERETLTRETIPIISLCCEQLEVWDLLDPGLTVLRGRMLQYMNGPRLLLAKMDLQDGKITKQEFMIETARALKMVKTATKCFDEHSIME